jgi:hypothetical protein
MDKKYIIIIGAVGLLIIGILIAVLFSIKPKTSTNTNSNTNTAIPSEDVYFKTAASLYASNYFSVTATSLADLNDVLGNSAEVFKPSVQRKIGDIEETILEVNQGSLKVSSRGDITDITGQGNITVGLQTTPFKFIVSLKKENRLWQIINIVETK